MGSGVVIFFFECDDCHRVAALLKPDVPDKCVMCGSTNGKRVTSQQFAEFYKAGVYFDLDSSGKRAKKKRTR